MITFAAAGGWPGGRGRHQPRGARQPAVARHLLLDVGAHEEGAARPCTTLLMEWSVGDLTQHGCRRPGCEPCGQACLQRVRGKAATSSSHSARIKDACNAIPQLSDCLHCFAVLTFVMGCAGQGHKQPLEAEDIFGLAPDDRVEAVSKDFRAQWHQELEKPQGPSLVRLLPLCTSFAVV